MIEPRYNYVLIGGGVTSASAAEAIRRHDPAGRVLIVGREVHRPYDRREVNKRYLRGETDRTSLPLREVGWYADHGIDLRTATRVTAIEPSLHRVTLDTGQSVASDATLLATGAQAATPADVAGLDLPGIYPVWTLDDADRLSRALEVAVSETAGRRAARAVIAGGGPHGAELVTSCLARGVEVTWLTGRRGVLGTIAGATLAGLAGDAAKRVGVEVVRARLSAVRGDGRAQRAESSDGRAGPCDLVILATGFRVNLDVLRGTRVAAETYVLADVRGRTNVEGLWAAGDVAAWLDPITGKHRHVTHFDDARRCGIIAGTDMAATVCGRADAPADPPPPPPTGYVVRPPGGLVLHAWGESRRIVRHVVANPRPLSPDATPDGVTEIGLDAAGRVVHVLTSGAPDAVASLVRGIGRPPVGG